VTVDLDGVRTKADFEVIEIVETGLPNPFPIGGPWCAIYKTHGHDPYHCPMMQKY
jgi:hypothetical protein